MDKVAIRISGDPAFFDEVVAEAARLDRSPSWLLGHCLGQTLPKLAGTLTTAPRAPKRSDNPHHRTFYVPKMLMMDCGRLAMRLGMTADDILALAWQATKADVAKRPTS